MIEEYYDIAAKCKVCEAPMVTSVHKECSDEWRDRLIGLLTCDHCMRAYAGSVRMRIYQDRMRREAAEREAAAQVLELLPEGDPF